MRRFILPAVVLFCFACGDKKDSTGSKKTSPQVTDDNGTSKATIPGGSDTEVTINGSAASGVRNASIRIPAGSLAVDTTLTVQQGSDISVFGQDLTGTLDNESLGPAVMVSPDQTTDPVDKIIIRIPVETGSALTEDGFEPAVIYQTKSFSSDKTNIGIAKGSDLISVKSDYIEFGTAFFGIFQVIKIPVTATSKEQETDAPMLPVSDPLGNMVGHWKRGCLNEVKDGKYESKREWLVVRPNFAVIKAVLFTDYDCNQNNKLMDIQMKLKYEVGGVLDEETNLRAFTITPLKMWVSPLTEPVAAGMRTNGFCGIKDFTLNVFKDISAGTPSATCGMPPMNAAFHATVINTSETLFGPDEIGKEDSAGRGGKTAATSFRDLHEHPMYRTRENPVVNLEK